ncbi:MAG TPA: RluA family pseudouridine synthase [Blastocatellia bacterium]|nr:RluA family pseudouridine synthase [Blastocatellia bacterium]
MTQVHFPVPEDSAGQRLDEFLAARLGALSRIRIANLIAQGRTTVNLSAAHSGYRVAAGDRVTIALDDGPPTAMTPEAIPLAVIYEDDHLIVVNKPAGMLMHPNKGVKGGTLANALAYHLNREYFEKIGKIRLPAHGEAHSLIRPGLAHRLDKETSGLVVVAKTRHALSLLTRHFQRRLVEKRYLALLRGRLRADAGSISAPIGRAPDRRPHWRVMESGKPAETRFRVLERGERTTLVELEPVTGRTNQLRIHCAYRGHPIVGDKLYSGEWESGGAGEQEADSGISNSGFEISNERAAILPPCPATRLCLHAYRLAFHHPMGGQWMKFTSALPPEMLSAAH